MKTFRIVFALALSALMVASCAYEYPMPKIKTNPKMALSGLQKFHTISIYDEQEIPITVNRTYGVSKELSLPLVINEDILNEYNTVYGTSLKMMEPSLYTLPESVTFGKNTQSADAVLKVRVKDLIAKVGAADAEEYVIPLQFGAEDGAAEIEDAGAMGSIIVALNISDPTIKVIQSENKLSFVSISKAKQSVTLLAEANFNTLDEDKVSFKVDESRIAEYNTANGTEYKALDSGYYDIKRPSFDGSSNTLSVNVEFDCASIGGNDSFLVPLVLEQSQNYVIEQSEPLYVIVSMTDFKVWIVKESDYQVIQPLSGKGELEVQINAPIDEDLTVRLKYDSASLMTYFASIGTMLDSMDASMIEVGDAVIPAGSQSCRIEYSFDLSSMGWDTGNEQMACLEIDSSLLPEGTKIDGKPAWFSAERSRRGDYTVTPLDSGEFTNGPFRNDGETVMYNNTWRMMVGRIWLVSENPKQAASSISKTHGQKYAVCYSDKWTDGWLYFDVSGTEVAGKPGCYALVNMQDRGCWWNPEANDGNGNWEGDGDWVTYNSSYFDATNGSFYFDFVIDNGNTPYEMGFIFTR